MTRRLLPGFLLLLALAAPALADEYTVTSFSGGYIEPPAVGATGSTVQIGANTDDRTVFVTLPFEFPYFGRLYDRISVSDNGWIAFESTASTQNQNPTLPSSASPNAVVAVLWDDLRTGSGAVKTFTQGVSPDRTFVVAWHHVDTFSGTSSDDLAFEVLLHERTGIIELAYSGTGTWDGLSYTAGIEDSTGSRAFGGPELTSTNSGQPNQAVRFTPKSVTITGFVLRDRPVAAATGLGGTIETNLPVVGADVVVVREDTGERVALSRTDAAGAFSVSALGVDVPLTLAVDLFASGEESKVTDAAGSTWRRRLASGLDADGAPAIGTTLLDASVDVVDPTFRKALNIQQAARRGFAFARDAAAVAAARAPAATLETFPQLEFRWVPGLSVATGYTAGPPARVDVNDSSGNPDAYDDDVILRECGRHVLATISVATQSVVHSWSGAAANENAAFVDGFGFWYASVVQGRSQFIDTTGPTSANAFDLEGPSPAVNGANVAGAVAASLWDLVDAANEAHDRVAGTPPASAQDVLAVLDRQLDTLPQGTTSPTARTFFDAWASQHTPAESAAAARDFIHHGALPDDAFEANDGEGEEAAFGAGTQRLASLILNPFNEDRFAFTLGGAGDRPMTVAVVQQDQTVMELSILDASGAVVTSATNAGVSDKSKLLATTLGPVPAGNYVARVVWTSGGTSRYALSFSTPVRLGTASLPDWTVGEVFKQDLVVDGGVAPLTVTMQGVPGLTQSAGGTRLTGAPSAAGDFVLHVGVLDSSGVGTTTSFDLPMHVNTRLSMVPLIGVAAGEELDLPLGTGGTGSVWTPTTPLDPPLTVVGGPTLRLTGDSGAPRAFDVTGSATQTIGASVPTATSHVVVSSSLADALGQNVQGSSYFGFWIEAVAGSRADAVLSFKGDGDAPRLVGLLDDAGTMIDVKDALHEFRRTTRIVGAKLPHQGRYFLVFGSTGFTGTVRQSRARIVPPLGARGVFAVEEAGDTAQIEFEALAGSKLRVVFESAPVPRAGRPDFIEVRSPSGEVLSLPNGRVARHGRRKSVDGIDLRETGRYVLRLGAKAGSTGPLLYAYRITPPPSAH